MIARGQGALAVRRGASFRGSASCDARLLGGGRSCPCLEGRRVPGSAKEFCRESDLTIEQRVGVPLVRRHRPAQIVQRAGPIPRRVESVQGLVSDRRGAQAGIDAIAASSAFRSAAVMP
jgi:hypothetical protein